MEQTCKLAVHPFEEKLKVLKNYSNIAFFLQGDFSEIKSYLEEKVPRTFENL